jgi:hypothetical protein
MTSEKKIAANRRNAQLSTGPRSAQGKATIARNAFKTGMWASASILLEGEDPEQWTALHDGLWQVFAPEGMLEEVLVTRIATMIWRLLRVERVEASLYTLGSETARLHREAGAIYINMTGGPGPGAGPISHEVYEGQAWIRMASDPDAWAGLARCEGALERSLYRALTELTNRQRARIRVDEDPDLTIPSLLPDFLGDGNR